MLGSYIGSCGPSILISLVVIYHYLTKKIGNIKAFKFPKLLVAAIFICFTIGLFQNFYKSNLLTSSEKLIDVTSDSLNIKEDLLADEKTIAERIHNEMLEIVEDENKDLPENLGNGVTLLKCELINKHLTYTICIYGLHPSAITKDMIPNYKDSMISALKEELANDPFTESLLDMMKAYDYLFTYNFVNEKSDILFTVNVSPFDI